ncbi:hypothetical protein ACFLZ9_01025 [Patescibacteria group bacterium]
MPNIEAEELRNKVKQAVAKNDEEYNSLANIQDLAGWRLETWYQVFVHNTDEDETEVGGYYKDIDMALLVGRKKGWMGSDARVIDVKVLTKDGQTGYIVDRYAIKLISNEEEVSQILTNDLLEKKNKGQNLDETEKAFLEKHGG